MLNNIPAELRALPQWVAASTDKIPVNPRTGHPASVTDPATWATYEEAIRSGMKYIGFVLTSWDPFTIIDLDNKPEKPCTEEQWIRHQKILETFSSYTERSASGRGYHIIVRGRIPAGVHRDNVEVYSDSRYMICTGDVVRPFPINDFQPMLDLLYSEMQPVNKVELEQVDGLMDDYDLLEMASYAANADKFNSLFAGDQTGYPSQSEADFALLSIIAFYTRDNEQVRRIFRMSLLGKREKAVKNNTYLDFALQKIRGNNPPPVDLSTLQAQAEAVAAQSPAPSTNDIHDGDDIKASFPEVSVPPGLVGEIAQYIYHTAVRPVPEIAITAAIAFAAGICGRSYNVLGSGLNQYVILLAPTGSGKEGASQGMDNLISAVRPIVPMADQFMGPAAFASGQALIKVLDERPCFVSVLGEFGLTLRQLSDTRANSAQVMLLKVLLDLYTKSGWNKILRSSVYSDSEKNTKIVQAPCVSIFGESTADTFFNEMTPEQVAQGLIPRFMVVEYKGQRPPRNHNANCPPNPDLVQRLANLITVSLTTSNNNTCCPVHVDYIASQMLDDFDAQTDLKINSSKHDVFTQVWNRAHFKAVKLAALLAVGVDPHRPVVTQELAQWAIDFVVKDVTLMTRRFQTGDVGQGDEKQIFDLKSAINNYFKAGAKAVEKYGVPYTLFNAGVVPYIYLQRKTAAVASFRSDKQGATASLKRSIQVLIDSGIIVPVAPVELQKNFKFGGVAYFVNKHMV